ncbi:DUF402 domain-containing protein [Nocardia sp. 004]|uniref:DUF402 domain-containing protein n=1 Tax=Nocardia sp. 004 TaxID=3385978 RepID=UPI0039A12509
MAQAPIVDVHRPKVEYFDITELTNTDPKGYVRPVDRYHVESWGLYMARSSDHPQFHYLESWLLPKLFLRATVFHYHAAHRRDQDYYLDVGEFTMITPQKWKSVDHYLDIIVRSARDTQLLDVDELLAAHATGLLTLTEAEAAVQHANAAIDGIAAHGHTLEGWLESMGITLTWL